MLIIYTACHLSQSVPYGFIPPMQFQLYSDGPYPQVSDRR